MISQLYKSDQDWFSTCLKDKNLIEKLKKIKLVISDVDGALTNGKIDYTIEGELSRSFSIRDGFLTNYAVKKTDLLVGFLSGKNHASATKRAQIIGIPEDLCFEGKEEKLVIIKKIIKQRNLELFELVHFGDDYLDIRIKLEAPDVFFVAPQDAPFYIVHKADLVVPRNGGEHAFRLLLDLILYVQEKHCSQELIQACMNN